MGPQRAPALKDEGEEYDEEQQEDLELEEEEEEDDEPEMDAAAMDDNDDAKPSQHRNRHRRTSLMEDSGMSEAERRALRHAQRQLQEEILESRNGGNKDDRNDDNDDNDDNDGNVAATKKKSSSNTNNNNNNDNSNSIESIRRKNNALYQKVAFTREAVLDGENLALLTKRAMEQVDRLIQVPRFDASRLARSLHSKCSLRNGMLDWKTLGSEAGICFNAVACGHVAFLNGPLQADYVPKPARQVQKRAAKPIDEEDDEEEEVEDVKQNANQGKLSQVEHNIDQVKKLLKKRCEQQYHATMALIQNLPPAQLAKLQETLTPTEMAQWVSRNGQDICAIQFLFNPQSFTQTVENIFYFSFLVKMGRAEILIRQDESGGGEDDEGEDGEEGAGGAVVHPLAAALASSRLPGPVIRFRNKNSKHAISSSAGAGADGTSGARATTAARQAIVSLTMQSWRELCEVYGVTKGDLPHRGNNNKSNKMTPAVVSPPPKKNNKSSKKRRDHQEEEDDDEEEENEEENEHEQEEDEDEVKKEVAAKKPKTTSRRDARAQPSANKKQKVHASKHDDDDEEEEN